MLRYLINTAAVILFSAIIIQNGAYAEDAFSDHEKGAGIYVFESVSCKAVTRVYSQGEEKELICQDSAEPDISLVFVDDDEAKNCILDASKSDIKDFMDVCGIYAKEIIL